MNEMTQVLGTVAMEPKGEWSSETYYEKLNTVIYNDSTYMAKEGVVGETPSESTKWQLIGGGVRYMHGETEDRPIDNLVVGQMFFDTTLEQPIWYDGTNWVDATGTSVEE